MSAPEAAVTGARFLFVWDDVLTDWTSGIMFAVASSVEEARSAIRNECSYVPAGDLDRQPKVYPVTETVARVVWGGG